MTSSGLYLDGSLMRLAEMRNIYGNKTKGSTGKKK
jgi:hypothetical protein